jgi:hypothetical protein
MVAIGIAFFLHDFQFLKRIPLPCSVPKKSLPKKQRPTGHGTTGGGSRERAMKKIYMPNLPPPENTIPRLLQQRKVFAVFRRPENIAAEGTRTRYSSQHQTIDSFEKKFCYFV